MQTTLTSTDIDVRKLQAGVVNKGGERFLHANGCASAADVASKGKQFLHWYQVALFITRCASCLQFSLIYISAGQRGLQLRLSPMDLIAYARAKTEKLTL